MGRDQYKRNKLTKIQEKRERIKTTESIRNLMNINIRAARSEIINYTEENPTDMYAIFLRGHIEEQLGNLQEAEKQYQKVAHSDSKNKYSAIIRLGDIARKLGQTAKARAYYLKAIAESPNEEIYAIHTLAKLERINKNYDEALRILKLVKKLDEKTKIEMVKTLSLQGKIQEARTLLKTINPTTPVERKEVELETGKIARREGNITKAKLHFSTVFVSQTLDCTSPMWAQPSISIANLDWPIPPPMVRGSWPVSSSLWKGSSRRSSQPEMVSWRSIASASTRIPIEESSSAISSTG